VTRGKVGDKLQGDSKGKKKQDGSKRKKRRKEIHR